MPSTSSWRDDLAPGDIISFVYPSKENDPRLECPRPCLVLEVDRSGAAPQVLVAYGTSALTRANTGHEIRVMQAASIRSAGLHKPTRFVAARRVSVALTSARIIACAQGTARIGRLSDDLMPRLDHVLSQLLTEAPSALPKPARPSRRLRRSSRPRAETGS